MNDWIEAAINYFLTGYSEFDLGRLAFIIKD